MADELRKQLKAPDKIQKTLLKLFESAVLYKKQIGLVLLPVVLIALGGIGYKYYNDKKTSERRAALGHIISAMDKENDAVEKKREEINKKIAELRKSKDPTKPAELSADAKKQVDELEKQSKGFKADHTASQEQFKAFYEKNKNNSEGWLAAMIYSSQLLTDKKFADAKTVVAEITQQSIGSKLYQTQSRFMMVGILEETGDFDGALKEADFLISYVGEDLAPQALLTKARVQIFKDAKGDAKTTLAQLIEKHSATPEAQKARAYLALIQ